MNGQSADRCRLLWADGEVIRLCADKQHMLSAHLPRPGAPDCALAAEAAAAPPKRSGGGSGGRGSAGTATGSATTLHGDNGGGGHADTTETAPATIDEWAVSVNAAAPTSAAVGNSRCEQKATWKGSIVGGKKNLQVRTLDICKFSAAAYYGHFSADSAAFLDSVMRIDCLHGMKTLLFPNFYICSLGDH